MQAGLLDYWEERFRPIPPQCQGNIKSFNPPDSKALKMKDHPPALTLKNLTGAFIVLLLGFSLSFLAFLFEKIISHRNHQSRRSKKARNNAINFDFQNKSAVNAEVENDIQENNEFNQTAKIKQTEPAKAATNIDEELENQSTQIGHNMSGTAQKPKSLQFISTTNDIVTLDIVKDFVIVLVAVYRHKLNLHSNDFHLTHCAKCNKPYLAHI